jgi:hypothetical protein
MSLHPTIMIMIMIVKVVNFFIHLCAIIFKNIWLTLTDENFVDDVEEFGDSNSQATEVSNRKNQAWSKDHFVLNLHSNKWQCKIAGLPRV